MSLLNYKGYTGSVEFSQEDNCLYGKVLGMKKDCISYEGETVSELVSDFEGAVSMNISAAVKPVASSLRNHTVADLFSVCRQTFIAESQPQQQDSE